MIRPVFFAMPGFPAERVVMQQEGGYAACPTYRKDQGAARPIHSLDPGRNAPIMHSQKIRLLRQIEDDGGLRIWLRIPEQMKQHFPDRWQAAQNGFIRFFRKFDHEALPVGWGEVAGIRLRQAAVSPGLSRLERKLWKLLYRPLSARETAEFLGLDKKTLRALCKHLGIEPCSRIPANRHGQRYSYAVYSVSDLIRMRTLPDPRGICGPRDLPRQILKTCK